MANKRYISKQFVAGTQYAFALLKYLSSEFTISTLLYLYASVYVCVLFNHFKYNPLYINPFKTKTPPQTHNRLMYAFPKSHRDARMCRESISPRANRFAASFVAAGSWAHALRRTIPIVRVALCRWCPICCTIGLSCSFRDSVGLHCSWAIAIEHSAPNTRSSSLHVSCNTSGSESNRQPTTG